MSIPAQHNDVRLGKINDEQPPTQTNALVSTHQPRSSAPVLQLDGPYVQPPQTMVGRTNIQPLGPRHPHPAHLQIAPQNSTQIMTGQQARPTQNTVGVLLPYCTMMPPLNGAQVIALSDVAGSLKELVLLALGAVAGDPGCVTRLEGAMGEQTAGNIAEFFMDEWELDG